MVQQLLLGHRRNPAQINPKEEIKMKQKKWLIVLMSLSLVLCLASCSTGGDNNEEETDDLNAADDTSEMTDTQENQDQQNDQDMVSDGTDSVDDNGGSDNLNGEEDGTAQDETQQVTMTLTVKDSSGAAIPDAQIDVAIDGSTLQYYADTQGVVIIDGIPAEGSVTISAADSQGENLAQAQLNFVKGTVSDVTESGDGSFDVTAAADQIEMEMTVGEDGTAQFALEAQI